MILNMAAFMLVNIRGWVEFSASVERLVIG